MNLQVFYATEYNILIPFCIFWQSAFVFMYYGRAMFYNVGLLLQILGEHEPYNALCLCTDYKECRRRASTEQFSITYHINQTIEYANSFCHEGGGSGGIWGYRLPIQIISLIVPFSSSLLQN